MAELLVDSRTFLLANTALAALIGTRIYPLQLPQNAVLPAVVQQTVSDVHELHQSGPAGYPTARVQYDCWGASYLSARAVAAALRMAVDGTYGAMGTMNVWAARVGNMIDLLDAETKRYRVLVDVLYTREE